LHDSLVGSAKDISQDQGLLEEDRKLEFHTSLNGKESKPEKTFEQLVVDEKRKSMSLSVQIRRNTAVDRILEKKCYNCNSLQPPYVFHCNDCKRCVVYMDHHCPWVNNCVGYYSQKSFVLFCGYGTITTFYSAVVMTHLYTSTLYGPDTP